MIRFKSIPKDIHQRIDTLVGLLRKEPNVVFAYLFGGLVRHTNSPLSDVDLALFLKDSSRMDYLQNFKKISDCLGTDEIDLVILNRAPLSLTGRILRNRKVLVDKKPFLRHRYESLMLREFFDFAIKERDILRGRYGIGR